MQKKIPMRQCLGCREMKPKKDLMRVVRTPEGEVCLDLRGKTAGRGAYVCHEKGCLDKALRSKAIARALEVKLSEELQAALRAGLESDS